MLLEAMKKNLLISLGVILLSLNSLAEVVTSLDPENSCTVFRVPRENKPIQSGESVLIQKPVYGLSLKNAKVDFENNLVEVDVLVRIVMGFNFNLTQKPVIIKPENKNFDFLVNQLNRTVFLFEKVCISNSNELLWASFFEPEPIPEQE
jgi:hypothetical protein